MYVFIYALYIYIYTYKYILGPMEPMGLGPKFNIEVRNFGIWI